MYVVCFQIYFSPFYHEKKAVKKIDKILIFSHCHSCTKFLDQFSIFFMNFVRGISMYTQNLCNLCVRTFGFSLS